MSPIRCLQLFLALISMESAKVWAEGMTHHTKPDEPTILWSRPVAVPTPAPSRVVIEGLETDGRFVPRAVSFPDDEPDKATKAPLPRGENLLGRFAPAGVVLETDAFHFPRPARLRLVVAGVGSGEPLGLSAVKRNEDATSVPQAFVTADGGSLQLPSNPTNERPDRNGVINCTAGHASFRISSVSLQPDFPPGALSPTGTWLWEAEAWLARPKQIEEWAVTSRLDRIFLQLKIDNWEVADRNALAEFVTRMGKREISVHAVDGDPAMVAGDGLDDALRRVAAIRSYQFTSQPSARLAGLQFDIEPYLLADFAFDSAAIWARWAQAIQAISSAWGEPVCVVVPFWMRDSEAGAAAVAAARPSISGLTVMAYRTETGEVTALSEPWLAWGTLNQLPISIAIENGPLGVEVHRTFVRAETGSLQLTEGGTATVSLLSQPIPVRQGALAYAFHDETRINPERISFMNDRGKLAVARAELARLLVAWPSFDALMIHALDGTDRGRGGPAHPDSGGQSQ